MNRLLMTIDPRKLRDCLGCFTTGVAIATTIAEDSTLAGLTINSFSSVSLDPPLVLFSIDRNAASFKIFCAAKHFAINVLNQHQLLLSQRFALSNHDKWKDMDYSLGKHSGCPLIGDALASFECIVEHRYEGGDHIILVGKVLEANRLVTDTPPLLYYQGAYRVLK